MKLAGVKTSNQWRWRAMQPMSFGLSNKIGCIAPQLHCFEVFTPSNFIHKIGCIALQSVLRQIWKEQISIRLDLVMPEIRSYYTEKDASEIGNQAALIQYVARKALASAGTRFSGGKLDHHA